MPPFSRNNEGESVSEKAVVLIGVSRKVWSHASGGGACTSSVITYKDWLLGRLEAPPSCRCSLSSEKDLDPVD